MPCLQKQHRLLWRSLFTKRSGYPPWIDNIWTGFTREQFFLMTVATIPVNLEFGTWFAIINTTNTSENDPVSLHDHLLHQPCFLQIKLVAKEKCLIVTTKSNLQVACEWIDANLEKLIWKSIPPGIDPPSSCLPRCLNKPVYSNTFYSYAEILKKQFSLMLTQSQLAAANNQPPCKWQATIINYDSDKLMDYPPLATKAAMTSTSSCHQPSSMLTSTTTPPLDYATDLMALKKWN